MTSTRELRVGTPQGRVYVAETPGDDPAIVMMHGFPDDHRSYDKLVPLLSPERAVVFDWLGYGRSDRPGDARFGPEDHAAQDAVITAGALSELPTPVTLIFGGRDRYLTADLGHELPSLFRTSSIHVLDDASHWPQWDQPQAVAQLILARPENERPAKVHN